MPNKTKIVAIPKTTTTTATFLPTSIAGCQLWLDGADQTTITQSGGTVSQWNDKSGNGYNFTQATTAYQPTFVSGGTNGLSLLRFNGTSQYLGGGTTLNIGTNNIAIFAVCKYAADVTLGSSYIFAKSLYGGAAARILFGVQSMGIGDGTGGNIWWQGSSYESSYASYHSVEFVTTRASGVNTFYANGTQFYQISPGVDTSTNWTSGYNMIVGGYNNPSGGISPPQPDLYMKGDICEILIYASTITTTNRQTIESYLAQKWGLTASLPAGHPGLTTMIYGTVVTPIPTTTTTTFLPTSIAGCSLWLDGADSTTMFQNTAGTTAITADGQTIGCWKDKSANAYTFTQATTGNQPTYKTSILGGRSITRWNGTSSGLQSSTTLPFYTSASSGGSFFFVFMVTSNNTQRFLMTYQNQNSGTFCVSESEIGCPTGNVDTGNFGIHQGCSKANVALNQVTTNTYMIMNLNLLSSGVAPTNTTIFKNGTSASMTAQNGGFYSGTSYPSTNNARYLNIGYRVPNGGSIDCWLAGDIAEIIWFQNPLNTTQQQTIEAYLAQKWGLTASLPAGHPGLTTSVYTITVALPKQKISSIPKTVFTSFLPTSITGCSLWLDAADLTSLTVSGGAVSQWNDKSGNANNATQSTSGNRPTSGSITQNGLNVLNLTSKTMTYPTISLTTMTVFCVYRQLDFTSYRQPLSVGAFAFFYANSGTVGIGRLAVTDEVLANWSTYGLSTSVYTIYGGTVSISGSTTTNMYFNGTNVASNTVNSSGGVVRYEIGRSELTNSGYIAEVLLYNSVLSQTNRQTVESYLAQKWGLTSQLPVGHPGLTTTVYGSATPTVKQKISAIPATVVAPSIPFSITSGLLAFFSFDNTLADSKNTITLAATGSVSYAAGRTTNQAIYLANEANISAGTYPSNYLRSTYNLPSVFTVSLWFKPTNTSRGNLFTSYNGFSPSNSPNNVLNIYIIGGAVYIAYSHIANNGAGYSITVGTWYNATITVNNGSFTLYMNGSQSGSTLSSTPYISGFSIGDYPESSSDFYTYAGYLDDYRIYNRVLTGTEISAIYAGTG